ncbi:hypothetical protein CCACVL1_08411 [Corchorus capsularis]|uniref:Uncharacterized protein n=1 Tax=Corchorus capsularis TaxID=210143 RepID=A0A1R3J0P9_COCAP|nr:hypothetical protein CCACVL1_08411 [Corchorus capsularis]
MVSETATCRFNPMRHATAAHGGSPVEEEIDTLGGWLLFLFKSFLRYCWIRTRFGSEPPQVVSQ